MQAVFLNCKLKSFQLAQRKSVLRVAPAPRIFVVSVCSFSKSFSAHHPAKKIAESLMIPENIVLRGKKRESLLRVRSWKEHSERSVLTALEESVTSKLLQPISKGTMTPYCPSTGCMYLLPVRIACGKRRPASGLGYHHSKNQEASKCICLFLHPQCM